jgi:hypothetical protein
MGSMIVGTRFDTFFLIFFTMIPVDGFNNDTIVSSYEKVNA